jgi:predicted site-specific integrase-resolvase
VKKTYSTKEAARQVGIHWVTLIRWQANGKVSASEEIGMNGGKHWRWTAQDISKIKEYKRKYFRKGQGRRTKKVEKLPG